MARDLSKDWESAKPLQADWDAARTVDAPPDAPPGEIRNSPPPLTAWDKAKRGMYGGLQDLWGQIKGDPQSLSEVQQREAEYQARRQVSKDTGTDWARLGGEMLNPINVAITAATMTPPGATLGIGGRVISPLVTRAIESGLGGTLMGMLRPVYGDETREGNAIAGGLGGAVSAPLAHGMARTVSPKVDAETALLRKEGVRLTPGQSFGGYARSAEDMTTSWPFLGGAINSSRAAGLKELNVAAYNRALSPIGVKYNGPVGQEGVATVRKTLSDAYNDILPRVQLAPDNQFTQEFTSLTQSVSNDFMEPEKRIFDNIISRLNNRSKTGVIDGQTLKTINTTLDDEIGKLRKDGRYERAELADRIEDLQGMIRGALKRTNPMWAQRIDQIDNGWANYAVLRDAAYKATSRNGRSDVFTPADLNAAVREGAKRNESKNAAKGIYTEGDALMQDLADAARHKLPSSYPDSGTAGRELWALLGGLSGAGAVTYPGASLGAAGLVGGASLPYLPGARSVADMLLNGRQGPVAQGTANLLRRASPLGAIPLSQLMSGGAE